MVCVLLLLALHHIDVVAPVAQVVGVEENCAQHNAGGDKSAVVQFNCQRG